jgi:G3E family GTPase
MSDKTTRPVTILTGFLGAGKTTFLNHMLQQYPDRNYAIIENEYGKESIDSELILRAEDGIVELNNGCLCCTLNDSLYDILNTLYERRDEYDEVIIEATGIADPRGLVAPFLSNYSIKKQFPFNRIICLVDAEQVEDQLRTTEEAIHQITFSDVLLINKIDLISTDRITELKRLLNRLNPIAEIITGSKDDYPSIEQSARNADLDEGIFDHSSGVTDNSQPIAKPHEHHHHDHTDGVVSHTLVFDKPFDYTILHMRVLGFLTFQAEGLYRMKGLIWVSHSDQQMLLQSVGSRLSIDDKRPWKDAEIRQSKIVVIGRGFQKKSLEKMFTQCLKKV